ncbi:NADP-dependent 3-hydroxy acid dehydrogenase YdfG [Roseovarius nanhaiticus]|uniref:NADP-dependent 3-hydroxy acid dehydrogenase YdfG n=1 Tax=Roseovarius nanhaiticus TaxID=573024 RepID=A0A1N7F6T0_9RHOB|nr:SDR family oxidoreductase [Roseovarius nanhaiticus]SEK60658.1 NADP-dependent 3-hydroxy acid dehydrogenase YdfG [Roseovarius nanhaiticus]SIR95945.1 NADP-dependent 3-hydroxy acid dehydrogenase YdfG [Roseovarius nanhaiticus]
MTHSSATPDMTGKSVLITGASRGIGAEAARVFAEAGAHLVLMARSADALRDVAAPLGAETITGDVAQYADVAAAVALAEERFGKLDVLIGNAGVIEPIAMMDAADPEAWGRAIDINLKGVFHGMRAAMPGMKRAGGGTILTVSSGAAHNPMEGWSGYCASKAGAAMLTAAAHHESAARGLRVMGLSPGTVATQMQRDIKASGVNPVSQLDWETHIPADWPARALLWMCGAGADAYLGQEISLRDTAIRATIGLGQSA